MSIPFSWNIITDVRTLWAFPFMQNAIEAGTVIAIVSGIIGYFVVIRRLAFATHALGHVGFSGAAGAVLIGWNPVYGLLLFTIGGAVGMGVMGRRAAERDMEIGIVLAFMLGLGLLFISLYKGYASEAYSILFGEILGISTSGVILTLEAALVVFVVMALVYRRLLFASLDEDVAEAKGLPILALGIGFLILLAIAISIAVQVIGVLLVFALMVTPAAVAVRLTRRPLYAMAISVLVSVLSVWVGLFVQFYEQYPASFFIVTIATSIYVIVRAGQAISGRLFHRSVLGEDRQLGAGSESV